MSFPVKALALVSGVGGVVAAGFGGVYFNSKETIGSKLGDDVLGTDDTFKDSWKNQHSKLEQETQDLKSFPKLKNIKNNKDQEKSWIELKNWCSESYSFTYKDMFSKEVDDTRLNLTRKYCIQTIKERLEALYKGSNKKVLDTSGLGDQSEFTNNYKKLKTHNEDTEGKLTGVLKDINKSVADSEATSNWSKAKDWCADVHKKPFKGVDNTFKLSEKLCVKVV